LHFIPPLFSAADAEKAAGKKPKVHKGGKVHKQRPYKGANFPLINSAAGGQIGGGVDGLEEQRRRNATGYSQFLQISFIYNFIERAHHPKRIVNRKITL